MAGTYFESSFAFIDADRTEQHLTDSYGPVVIDREFRHFSQDLAGDSDIQLHTGRFEGSYSCTIEIGQFVIASAVSTCLWEEGTDRGDMAAQPVIFRPETPYVNQLADTENRAVVFDPDALQRTAGLVYGRDDIAVSFDGPHPVTPKTAATWLAAVALARAHQQTGLLADDLIRASLFRLLSITALHAFRLRGDRLALHASAERLSRVYHAATTYLHDNAALPITVDDAAAATGASGAELVAAFRAHDPRQDSPDAYLRSVRLRAAFDDLRAADPTRGDTVGAIARRWGFASPSRFAAHVRASYGVTPKWVLDR